ncbi:MAG: nucleotidyltransferase family protein [Clostridiales bacterium]|jgi:predicted nucleotidyltransferase|nr:nucleotidyltransferase family protein [Clostridiales bacterium]
MNIFKNNAAKNPAPIVGIIAEYNPLHNGHIYHIQQTKAALPGCKIIVTMSGNFVQRGDVAIINKFIRANHAILAGADIVVELPTYIALQPAQNFAHGALSLLNACNITHLSFGAENADLATLSSLAVQPAPPKNSARANNFPAFLAKSSAAPALFSPNNILAIEYLRAISDINPNITPLAIARTSSTHDSDYSAKAIRANLPDAATLSPNYVAADLLAPAAKINRLDNFADIIFYALNRLTLSQLRDISEVTEGLENRIKSALSHSTTLPDLISNIKSKRYTEAKIRRILLKATLGITKAYDHLAPTYARILAANKKSMSLLKPMQISTIIKPAEYLKSISAAASPNTTLTSFTIDTLATDIYNIPLGSPAGEDFTRKFTAQ